MAWYRNPYGPLAVALICGVFVFIGYFFPGIGFIDAGRSYFVSWTAIITVMMCWIGFINVIRFAYRDIPKRTPGRWWLAVYQIALVSVMVISGFAQGAGSVGKTLIEYLVAEKAEVLFSDVDEETIHHFRDELGLEYIDPEEVYLAACDIFAPCALDVLDSGHVSNVKSQHPFKIVTYLLFQLHIQTFPNKKRLLKNLSPFGHRCHITRLQ